MYLSLLEGLLFLTVCLLAMPLPIVLCLLFLHCRYSILGLTLVLMLMSFLVIGGSRPLSEGFCAFWSGCMLVALSIGGTMIMRKFHNSMAVGFFMGSVVATSQLFFLLSLLYVFVLLAKMKEADIPSLLI